MTEATTNPAQASDPGHVIRRAPGTAGLVHRTALRLPSRPGVELHGTWHEPNGPSRGVAVVAPGVAVPARVVEPLADALAKAGWTAISFDFPGVGDAPAHPRRVPGGMADWGRHDLEAVLQVARRQAGDLPVVLVGHSAGAWLANLAPSSHDIDAIVAIASMSGHWRTLKPGERPRLMAAFFGIIPLLTRTLGHLPGWAGLGVDAPGGAMAQWAAWCRRRGFFWQDDAVTTYERDITAPVRVLLPTDDEWATLEACRAVWDRLPDAAVHYVEVDPADHGGDRIGHIGLLRDRFADSVWAEAIAWLETAAN